MKQRRSKSNKDNILVGLGKAAVSGAAAGVAAGARTTLDAVVDGLHAANPWTDITDTYTAARNIAHDGVSIDNYVVNLKRGKFLGEGNAKTIAKNIGLLASGLYVPFKAYNTVLAAAGAVARNFVTSDEVKHYVGRVSNGARRSLDYVTKKENWNKLVSPRIAEASLGLLGYAPVAWMWGAQAAASVGKSLGKSKWTLVKGIGNVIDGVGTRVNNVLDHYTTASVVSNAYNSTSLSDVAAVPKKLELLAQPQTYANIGGQFVQEVGKAAGKLEDLVVTTASDGAHYVANDMVADITAGHKYITETEVAQIAKDTLSAAYDKGARFADGIVSIGTGEQKVAVLIAGFQGNGEDFHEKDLAHNYESLRKAGFDKIYVLAPEAPDTAAHPECKDVAEAFKDTSYSHECTKDNLKNIFEKVAKETDGNDVVVTTIYSHGLFTDGYSTAALDNGKQTLYSTELRDMQEPIRAGKELNVVSTCQAGDFAVTAASGTDVITDCLHSENAQAENSYGSYVMSDIAKNGFSANTDVLDLAKRADKEYSAHTTRDLRQDPAVRVGGNAQMIDTRPRSGQKVEPYVITNRDETFDGFDWRN